jgi:hypothetical protein
MPGLQQRSVYRWQRAARRLATTLRVLYVDDKRCAHGPPGREAHQARAEDEPLGRWGDAMSDREYLDFALEISRLRRMPSPEELQGR